MALMQSLFPSKSTLEMRALKSLGYAVGMYTHDQKDAAALATIFNYGSPEVHSSGQYGHYNDTNHYFHIWFGGMLQY